jgi:hypothetical protein
MWGFWILLILVLLFAATVPIYPHSRSWGFGPIAVVLMAVALWMIVIYFGYVAFWWPWAGEPVPPM